MNRTGLVVVLQNHHPIRDEGTNQVVCWCLWKPRTRLYGFAEWDAVWEHVADEIILFSTAGSDEVSSAQDAEIVESLRRQSEFYALNPRVDALPYDDER